MYKLYRFGRQYGSKTFASYETARSYVRKTVRSWYAHDGSKCTDRAATKVDHTSRWNAHKNANLGAFGFSIKR